jgi:signal peptidase I
MQLIQIVHDRYWHKDGYTARAERGVRREILETITLTLFIFFVVRAALPSYWVQGESMLPTLYSEERVLVNKALYQRYDANFLARVFNPSVPTEMRYLLHGPQRGDIVVFKPPVAVEINDDFIKRVIAVEGETVEIKPDGDRNGNPHRDCGQCGVYVNGVKLYEPYVKQTPDYALAPTRVPPGQVFVLGDNRRNSSDSHIWGTLEIERIVGTAFVSFWPLDHWGFFPHPTYAEIKKQP